MKTNIIQHYPLEKRAFVKGCLFKIKQAVDYLYPVELGFCDSFEQEIITRLTAKTNLKIIVFDPNFERKYLIIVDKNYEYEIQSPIMVFGYNYNSKYKVLQHRHVLGTILNNPIEYSQIGDIYFEENKIFVIGHNQVKDNLDFYLQNISNVKTKPFDAIDFVIPEKKLTIKEVIISTNRLDLVVKVLISKSRERAKQHIQNGLARHNQVICTSPEKKVVVGDTVSVRGYTKIKIIELQETRSGKIKVIYS